VGNELRLGKDALVRVTQIGKECHDKCNIYYQVGDCIMPREGIFAEVLKGGEIKVDDYIGFVNDKSSSSNN
ncbi:MAG: MOSC domain-containing protein, partial [Candidatus Scalindua sp.]|nr:MOSC domain-containing protein [Candidatus Scalindua sp.]